jgi:CheY-like chemotaxis protein
MIIIVDEEKRRLSSIVLYLEECGYQAVIIDGVDEARDYVKQNFASIDAIILDLMMPWGAKYNVDNSCSGIITGYLFYNELRDELDYTGPVIIYTAAHRPDLFKKLRREVNCSILHKPDSVLRIIQELEKYGVSRPQK